MTYNEFIQNIIDTRGQWGLDDSDIFESHHIIPKCMGGEPRGHYNRYDHHPNLIRLTIKEHYEAHRLLALENLDNEGLQLSWNYLAYTKCGDFLIADQVEELKLHAIKFSESHIQNIKNNHADVSGENNPMYCKGYLISGSKNGRYGISVDELTRKKISDKRKLQTDLNNKAADNLMKWRASNPDKFSRSQSRPRGANGKAIKVRCVENDTVFDCLIDVFDWLKSNNLTNDSLKVVRKKIKRSYLINESAYGFHWERLSRKKDI